MSTDPVHLLLALLKKVKPLGRDKWKACCPAHDDNTPSLSIACGRAGQVLMHCHGCGASGLDVCRALDIDPSVLFPERGSLQTGRRAMPILQQPQAVIRLKRALRELWELAALSHKQGSIERIRALAALQEASGILDGVMP